MNREFFFLIDGYGQETDLGLLHPTTMVPGGEPATQVFRPYGERQWSYAGDRLPSPEPWVWQGGLQAESNAALKAELAKLEAAIRNAIRVRRQSDGGTIDLDGGSRPMPTPIHSTRADVTLSLFPITDAWTVADTRDYGEGDWGEGDWGDGSGFLRTF